MSKEKCEIELINVGRVDACRIYESHCDTLVEVEAWALTHCKKYLASKYVYLEHHRDFIYGVYAGDRLVGHVKITSTPEKTKCQKQKDTKNDVRS